MDYRVGDKLIVKYGSGNSNSSEKSFKWFMNTHCCGHADGYCIYIHIKPLITINTSYGQEVCYIFNHKTSAASKPPQYVVFDVCPDNMSRILKCQFPSQLFELICHNTFTVLTSSQEKKMACMKHIQLKPLFIVQLQINCQSHSEPGLYSEEEGNLQPHQPAGRR